MPTDSYTDPFHEPLSSSNSPKYNDKDIGLSLSDNDNGTNDNDDDVRRIRDIGDENPHLMAYLDNSDSDQSKAIATSSEDDGDDLDDSRIEASEEQAIRADFSESSFSKSSCTPGPVSLRRLSESQHTRAENSKDSEDSDSDASSSWGNDFFEDYFDLPTRDQNALHHRKRSEQRLGGNSSEITHESLEGFSDDDSYLWQYFFSSDEGERASMTPGTRARQRRLSRSKWHGTDEGSTDDEMPLKGRGPLPVSQITKTQQPPAYVPSGDSTDEDDGVPPEHKRRRARGTKAIEVLGSNSFSARPPVLGSWRIKDNRNVGIIDGLTTRTLSPPPQSAPLRPSQRAPAHSHNQGESPSLDNVQDPFEELNEIGDQTVIGNFTDFGDTDLSLGEIFERKPLLDDPEFDQEVSDLDLLELGDFINTESLSSDENDHRFEFNVVIDPQKGQKQYRSPAVSPYLYRNRMSARNVPISAFRNRGSPYVDNAAYPAEIFSPVPRRNPRRTSLPARKPHLGRDTHISPSYQKKRGKRTRPQEGTDLIGELIEIGAISPLFEIDK